MKLVTKRQIAETIAALRNAAAGGPMPEALLVPAGEAPSREELLSMAERIERLASRPPLTEQDVTELLATGEVEDLRRGTP